jgi:hypothetical protein
VTTAVHPGSVVLDPQQATRLLAVMIFFGVSFAMVGAIVVKPPDQRGFAVGISAVGWLDRIGSSDSLPRTVGSFILPAPPL